MSKKRLFLIDGNAFCYRAYYAIRSLSNSKGQPTNAVYGFVTMLNKIIKDESPDYLCIAFDTKAPTFRHKRLETYKITRKPMPDDLSAQMPIIKDIVRAYGIPMFEKEGYEADDIIATISKRAAAKSVDTSIMTGDKDILQLVGPHIVVCNTHKEGLVYDEAKVKERYGVGPENIVDLMALMGDQSDNYKGVPGIGEVAASELVKEFGSIDNLYKNLKKVKREGWRKILEKHEEDARQSRELAILDADVPIEFSLEKLLYGNPDTERLTELFRELEFKSLLMDVMHEDEWVADYKTIFTKDEFKKFLSALKKEKETALDFETTSSNPIEARLVGVSFCWKEKEAHYIPLENKSADTLDRDYVLRELKDFFEDEKVRKIGQNIKYEKLVLLNYGIDLKGIAFDTMVASYLLNPSKLNHSLGDIAIEYLGHKMTPISDLIGKGKKAITMDEVEVERVSRYCCEDSDVTFRLKNILEKRLSEQELDELFYEIEIPLIDVLSAMELKGVALDVGLLGKMSSEMDKTLNSRVSDIYKISGFEFNINSPKQLSEILFEKLGLPVIKRTKTGISTDEEVLRKLAAEHTLPAAILEYRELAKLKSTYIDNLPKLLSPKTERLHTSFNQTITATGRLSSSQPNLQNIPIKREMGKRIRQAFIPESDEYILLSSDYSQIELRILAHLSGDKRLIDAFKKDLDIHIFTASLVNDIPEEKVTPEMRMQAKTVNFGIVYGMSAYGLSRSLKIDPAKAQEFIDAYFERYPDVKLYMEDTIEEARGAGYVTTLMKRKRFIPDIRSENIRLRQFAERTAINTPIQGSAADIIKVAMIDIYNELGKKTLKSSMILQVHDELVFEVLKTELKKVKKIVKEKMENVVELKVPIKTNISVGNNWLDLKELG
ncbi:MAG: DNA polymerase I [Candidatus Omnitrophica bacterium]|nr:DNA polymerase I [Candidatus Omnitrophota bacterium]